MEGNRLDFAYDSHMQNLGNFAHKLEAGETNSGHEQLQEPSEKTAEQNEDEREQKIAESSQLTDF